MNTVTLKIESYLFQYPDKTVREIPFYELSIEEWVIYEDGQPTYFIDFNKRSKPVIQHLKTKLEADETLEELVNQLGIQLGRNWMTLHGITGQKVPGSEQIESITLNYFDELIQLQKLIH